MPAVELVESEGSRKAPVLERIARTTSIPFIDAETNRPVSINAALVCCVREHDSNGNTRIEFSRDHWVAVKSDVKSVSAKLFGV